MKILKLLAFLIFPLVSFSQTNFSISANVGLVAAGEDLGKGILVSPALEFERTSLHFSYLYSKFDDHPDETAYRSYKYSVSGGYNIFSDDRKFQFSGSIGPSLMYFKEAEPSKPMIGLDLGLALSYSLFWDVLHLEMGVTNTLNKETKTFVYPFFGLKYNFIKRRGESNSEL